MPEDKSVDKARADYISVRNIKFRPDASMLEKIKKSVRFERAKFSTRSKSVKEEAMLEKLKDYISANGYINRSAMETLFGLRKNAALEWLKHFTEIGILRKKGTINAPVYFWNSQYNVQKITSAENLRLRVSDEIIPFREFIIWQVFGNWAKHK